MPHYHNDLSPPSPNCVNYDFLPHLDDIYEYKTDHQYFTHSGTYEETGVQKRTPLMSEKDRNMIFRAHAAHSLDEYASPPHLCLQRSLQHRQKFDNSSFIKSLSNSTDNNSNHHRASSSAMHNTSNNNNSSTSSSGSASSANHHHQHHHHSIQEMIKHFGKKVHIWPRNRHHHHHDSSHNLTSLSTQNDLQDDFRERSKSLDVADKSKKVRDWGQTYKIYDRIVKEGEYE